MPKILIVDDAAFLRRDLTQALSPSGYELFEAENGSQAVEVYKQIQPDVVLLDVSMPGMDGLSTLRQICQFDTRAKVIMLMALGQEAEALEAVRSGAKDFVIKPFEQRRVLNAVAKLLP